MKSPARFTVRSVIALALTGSLVACADQVMAPVVTPPAGAPAARSVADVSGGCADIAAAHPGSPDGDYAVRGPGNATFKVYCLNMSSAPATYLTLAISGPESGKNFGSWYGEFQHLWEDHIIETYYSRLRFDPATLRVDNNDITFSTTIGGRAFGPGVYLYSMAYANAGDCLGYPPSGKANIDLNGTPFSIDETFVSQGWVASGSINGVFNDWDQQVHVTGKTVDLVGGGFCGGTNPIDNASTHFAFTGPGLSSPLASLTATPELIEGATTATFTSTASHPDAVPFWTEWSLGDGTTGSGAIPTTHTYASTPGSYTVSFSAYDGATAPTTVTQVVTVISRTDAARELIALVAAQMSERDAKPLIVSLEQFIASIDKGNMNSASGQLGAFDNKLQAALDAGKITDATYGVIAASSQRIHASMGQ